MSNVSKIKKGKKKDKKKQKGKLKGKKKEGGDGACGRREREENEK